ncbi:MAG: sulfatase-like hydrolase/transferase [Verrucomicrobiota bacterium]
MIQLADATSEEGAKPLNVLMISIDDLNDWTGFLGGHPQALTPHMDALAESGRIFANAHCPVPVCSSSRVSVMSGVAATTHGSYELGSSYEELPALEGVPTIQRHFKENGYIKSSRWMEQGLGLGAYSGTDAEMADYQLAEAAAGALQEDFDKPFLCRLGSFVLTCRRSGSIFMIPKG